MRQAKGAIHGTDTQRCHGTRDRPLAWDGMLPQPCMSHIHTLTFFFSTASSSPVRLGFPALSALAWNSMA